MRDLLTNPAWQPADLGVPLPDSPHAVSVAMPSWQDVIDYEEGRPELAAKLQSGYPRFFCHPLVTELFNTTASRFASEGEGCIVYPSRASAERCLAYVSARSDLTFRLENLHGAACAVVFPEPARKLVREYWRYCGETLSSRMAAHLLAGHGAPSPDMEAAGRSARLAIRSQLAALHRVSPEDVFLFPSGMAAIAAAHRLVTAAHPGLPSLQLDFPYVDALKVQQEFGSGVRFLASTDDSALAEIRSLAGSRAISSVFCEMPSNPLLRSARLSAFAPQLRNARIPLVVDDTVASVVSIHALRFADLVTTSLTKSFSGTGDVLAGSLVINPDSPHHAAFRAAMATESPDDLLWCEDAVALAANARDFPARVVRSHTNAAALAAWLDHHPAIDSVWYPRHGDGLDEILRPGAGRGCLLSFTLRNQDLTPVVYDRLRVSKGPSLGTNFTLCCPYTLLAHYTELDWAADCGVPARLLRVSTGLEDSADLIARFRDALDGLS